jgi:N-acetyl-gamma-glutamyl-phosphate reductase
VSARLGLVGARGYAGRELLRLVAAHPDLDLAFAASRVMAGRPIGDAVPGWQGDGVFVEPSPDLATTSGADVIVLALPNGVSDDYLAVIDADTVVVDLSADHRFDSSWVYGLAELGRGDIAGARRIANPGCYATAAMLGLDPLVADLAAMPAAFGVSGFSGAGTDPSPKNDPAVLRDNVMPYKITGHVHEREIGHQLGSAVRFAPSVASFERGLVVTILAELREPTSVEELRERYLSRYGTARLIEIVEEAPLPRDVSGTPGVHIGGFSVDDRDTRRIGVVAALDNLLKGAASQALQNINLACGFPETAGLSDSRISRPA